MRKLFLAILLALVCASPLTMNSCTMLTEQYENLHAMEQTDFDKLAERVQSIARVGGRALKKKIKVEETRRYIIDVLEVILKQDTKAAFVAFVSNLELVPEYKPFIKPALAAALDLIEAAVGVPFSLDAHANPRDLALIRALLRGLHEGLTDE